ncbi:glycosyltransferase family 39 protein [Massilia sp.]|uniref:glycosyltransferase family 39 protein n=1 Tax=Massilia sp. TaxID=1882437 RepID=UPI0028989D9D|nr:glycosyltransferase family 39 protein [Massilia sp.]
MLLHTAPDGTQVAARELRREPWIPRRAAVCLFVGFCLVWFYTLGARTLVPSDEGRYAEIAREMAASGDFLTPHLNGIKYFGKPPLQAWATALVFSAFGLGEWQARLWTGLCGLAGIVMVYLAGSRLYGRATGITAALVLGSSFFWAGAGHVASYDMGLSAMLACALCAMLIAQRPATTPRARRNWMLGCWAAMALAVLSKGLVGILLPGMVLVVYTLVSGDWRIWQRLHVVPGLALFLAIAAPWFVLVSLENPEFPAFFFMREHVGRFTSDVHSRYQPWHYFLPFLVVGIAPWFGVLAQSLRHGWRAGAAGFDPGRFLVVWAGSIFVFFSLSNAKLPAYILPVFPALALLIARYLDSASHKATIVAAAPPATLGAAVLVFQWIGPALNNMHALAPAQRGIRYWIAGAAALLVLGGIAAAWLAPRARAWALTVLAAAGFLAGQALMLGHESWGRDKAGVAHLPAIRSAITPQTPLYAVGQYEYALPFYLGRTMIMVHRAEDAMRLDLERRPHLWISRLDTFVATWEAQRARGIKAIAFVRPDIYADLRRRGVPMRVIGQDARRVIVTNDVPAERRFPTRPGLS